VGEHVEDVVAGTGHEVAKQENKLPLYPGTTPEAADEPSAAWGWHGGFPKASLIAGWVSVVVLLAMLIGNHKGHVEDLWLVVIAGLMAFGLVLHTLKQRRSWRN
jgi:hypothetical protein